MGGAFYPPFRIGGSGLASDEVAIKASTLFSWAGNHVLFQENSFSFSTAATFETSSSLNFTTESTFDEGSIESFTTA